MINLNINEKKSLQFDVSVSGVDMDSLKGSMKIVMEGIEYGFPIKVIDGKIVVNIPPLTTFLKEDMLKNQTLNATLEIIADDTYLVPWEDQILLESPVRVEAVVSDIKGIMEKVKPQIISIKNPKIIAEEVPVEEEEADESCGKDHDKKKKKKSKFAEALEK